MGFENHSSLPPEEEKHTIVKETEAEASIRERIVYPHVDAALALVEKEIGGEGKETIDREAVKDILWEFIDQHLRRAGVYASEQYGAAFPYTSIDTGALAKELYSRYTGKAVDPAALEKDEATKKVEFIFTAIPPVQSLSAGSIFGFMEEMMHQAIRDLPQAIERLKQGKEPEAHEVYNLGSPTNALGTMSPEFLEKLKDDRAFAEFGGLYAEFIESKLPPEEREETRLFLYGQSTGSSFAAETAARLMAHGTATQSVEEERERKVPFMQVRLDMPVGSSDVPKARKRWQIPLGFLADASFTIMTDGYMKPVMKKDKEFLGSTGKVLAERGLVPHVTPEQVELKKKASWEVLQNLRNGTPIPEGLKVTKVVGGNDVLMWSGGTREAMDAQAEAHKGSLGENVISKEPDQRTFGIKSMHHSMPYFRTNELKRLVRAAAVVGALRKG